MRHSILQLYIIHINYNIILYSFLADKLLPCRSERETVQHILNIVVGEITA